MKKKKSPREKLTCHNMPESVMKEKMHFRCGKAAHKAMKKSNCCNH